MRPDTFQFNHNTYRYAKSPAGNERTVEVALAVDFLDRYTTESSSVLEIGNVMNGVNQFDPTRHERVGSYAVLDKFEQGPNVINEDLRTYESPRLLDVVFSVSTLEHVGVDENEKASEAILGFRQAWSFLKHNGGFFFTIPVGFNSSLERAIVYGWPPMHIGAMKRVSTENEWDEVDPKDALQVPYGRPYRHGNAVLIGTRPPTRVD